MSDYVTEFQEMQRRCYEAAHTSDHTLIGHFISGDYEDAKCYLVDNHHLTEPEQMALADDESVNVRIELAKSRRVTSNVLHLLRLDKSDIVRVHALCNPLTDSSHFVDAVLNDKFSVTAKRLFCENFAVLESFEVFEFLWKTVKHAPPLLMSTLHGATYTMMVIDSKILSFVHSEILSGEAPNAVRETYAGSAGIALPEILDGLRDDPCRPVINAISRNASAWVSTHEYLAFKHKSSEIRTSIAMVTKDNVLLNKIYHGTKSKEIRYWVEANPVFISE